jgi:hypothetical protein
MFGFSCIGKSMLNRGLLYVKIEQPYNISDFQLFELTLDCVIQFL